MKRRDLILASAGLAGGLIPGLGRGAEPCPPPQVGVGGGTTASTACPTTASRTYTTNFPGSEYPLSEGGAWTNAGQYWTKVVKNNGIACGTQTGSGNYDDSYAHLTGFPPNVVAMATIAKAAGIPSSEYHEVELLLRWNDSASSAAGYECNLHHAGSYAQIVRWNGPRGNFTYLADSRNVPAPKDGDIVKATVVGNVITFYLNDVRLAQATDSTFTSGNPGIGFYIQGAVKNEVYGFKSFTANSL